MPTYSKPQITIDLEEYHELIALRQKGDLAILRKVEKCFSDLVSEEQHEPKFDNFLKAWIEHIKRNKLRIECKKAESSSRYYKRVSIKFLEQE